MEPVPAQHQDVDQLGPAVGRHCRPVGHDRTVGAPTARRPQHLLHAEDGADHCPPSCFQPAAAPCRSEPELCSFGHPRGTDGLLRGALLESRQRWRDFVTLASDLAFEVDAEGLLSFLAPEGILGWPAGTLLHRPAALLLAPGSADPFALRQPTQGIKAWLQRPEGGTACFAINLVPLADAAGRFAGLRGIARDITAEEAAAESQAVLMRRAGALELLVRRLRRDVLAPRLLSTTLEALPAVLGCAGAAVLEFGPDGGASPQLVQRHGADPIPLLAAALALRGPAPTFGPGPDGESLALVPRPIRGAAEHALLVWRGAGTRGFDDEDRALLASLSDIVFMALGNQALQRELELQARTEALTGLLNRRAFLADLGRRLDRREREASRSAGALLFLDLDNFKPINDLLGHEAGDAALVAVANLLRDLVRPTDLVARLGGDEFALWLDEASVDTACARAEALAQAAEHGLPALLRSGPTALTFSIGCAIWHPGETPERLLARADTAMYAAKHAGRDCWRLHAMDAEPMAGVAA